MRVRRRLAGSDGDCGSNNSNVFLEVKERIASLDFRSFQTLVLLYLGNRGFGMIQALGRRYRRGRRAVGGSDFLAVQPGSDIGVGIQVRHWRSPLQRRAIDELWGYMLRHDVPTGLIITNSSVYPKARQAAAEFPGRPIRLITGAQLARWLFVSGLADFSQPSSSLDAFFRTLEALGTATFPWSSQVADGGSRPKGTAYRPPVFATTDGVTFGSQPPSWIWPALLGLALVLSLLLLIHQLGGRR